MLPCFQGLAGYVRIRRPIISPDGPLSLPIALPDRLTQITYAIRVKALLVSHRTCRVRTHSGFFRALFVSAGLRGSPSLFRRYRRGVHCNLVF